MTVCHRCGRPPAETASAAERAAGLVCDLLRCPARRESAGLHHAASVPAHRTEEHA